MIPALYFSFHCCSAWGGNEQKSLLTSSPCFPLIIQALSDSCLVMCGPSLTAGKRPPCLSALTKVQGNGAKRAEGNDASKLTVFNSLIKSSQTLLIQLSLEKELEANYSTGTKRVFLFKFAIIVHSTERIQVYPKCIYSSLLKYQRFKLKQITTYVLNP